MSKGKVCPKTKGGGKMELVRRATLPFFKEKRGGKMLGDLGFS